MLEAVVSSEDGTGHRAAVRNYRVAGKTGTAWKSAIGGYSKDRYTAVFAGLVPASAPKLVVVVVIDEPQGPVYYGGDVAAPVFANIVSGAMRVLAVPPDALPQPAATIVAQARVIP
jgi:cell division protein FtsI (penicillin-binding protein 3)